MALTAGNGDEALRHAAAAAELGPYGLAGEPLARAELLAARIETAAGTPAAALAYAAAAERHALPGSFVAACTVLRRAEALCAAGAFADGKRAADEAVAALAGCPDGHDAGAALVAAGRARHGLGDRSAALGYVGAGVERLRRGGFVVDLARALELGADVSGCEAPRREAEELLAAARQ